MKETGSKQKSKRGKFGVPVPPLDVRYDLSDVSIITPERRLTTLYAAVSAGRRREERGATFPVI